MLHRPVAPLFSLALACALALSAGCDRSQKVAATAPEPEVEVLRLAPARVALDTVLAGRTAAFLAAEVRPQVGGIIQKRLFKEGAEVAAGEVLYQIDPATYQAAHDNAKAALAKAEASAAPARLKARRYAELARTASVSDQENDEAQAACQQAEAEVLAGRAALETARINLAYTKVSSPIAGRIGASAVTPGALVTAEQATALALVQQIDPIYVDLTQSNTEILRLRRQFASGRITRTAAGQAKVRLLLEDGSPYPLEGSLQFSDISVDQGTGMVKLRALFPNPDHELLPGQYVRAVLEEGVEERALLAPQTAVQRDPKGQAQVLVLGKDGVVELRAIEAGRVVGDKWLVNSGLAAGEQVIVSGLQKVRPGAKAKAAPPAPGAPAPKPADAPKP